MEADVATELATELHALRKAQEEREQRSENFRKRLTVGGLLVVLAVMALWFTGSLDGPLSSVGLNKNDCAKNGFGATFCGDDLTTYQRNLGLPITSGDADSARADLRVALPSIEAYYSDHNSYAGATADLLRTTYDAGLPDITVYAQTESYCLEAPGGDYHYNGPGGSGALAGSC